MKKNMFKALILFILVGFMVVEAKKAVVGYQGVFNPFKYAIDKKLFEKATKYDIEWRKFDSGGAVINAMASGNVDIAMAGSSPIAAGVSRGVDVQVFWVMEDIASAEALVVRDGSGIIAPQDLKGKTLAVPFVSTTHFHTLFALEQFGINPKDVNIRNMQPGDIATAWQTKRIDAAFIWDPALGTIKKTGKVLITSGTLSTWGKATFDGTVVGRTFARKNKDFMNSFVKVLAETDADYRDNPKAWSPNSKYVKSIVKMVGGDAKLVPGTLALYNFLTLQEQASSAWLGGGKNGGVARALQFTSEFLKGEGKIDKVANDYSKFVNPSFVKANL